MFNHQMSTGAGDDVVIHVCPRAKTAYQDVVWRRGEIISHLLRQLLAEDQVTGIFICNTCRRIAAKTPGTITASQPALR